MNSSSEPGISRKIFINSAIMMILVVAALVLFFVFGRDPTPIGELSAPVSFTLS